MEDERAEVIKGLERFKNSGRMMVRPACDEKIRQQEEEIARLKILFDKAIRMLKDDNERQNILATSLQIVTDRMGMNIDVREAVDNDIEMLRALKAGD